MHNAIRQALNVKNYKLAHAMACEEVRCGDTSPELKRLLWEAKMRLSVEKAEKASVYHAPSYFAEAAQAAFLLHGTESTEYQALATREKLARRRALRSR